MIVGGREFSGKTYVMAIINLTPDSFWQGSRVSANEILYAVERAEKEGAAIVDIGAQSTRPGYTEISADEEIERFLTPLKEIKRNFDLPVSVDTYFPQSARAALDAGADMINDIWGLTREGMAETVAEYRASVCIMHNSKKPLAGEVFPPVYSFLKAQAQKGIDAGISPDKICLDGGLGFAKNAEQSLSLLRDYPKLCALGYPLLLGASRKSMFGGKVEDRLEKTLQSTRLAARAGVLFVRVHDVAENVRIIEEEL